MKIVTHYSIVHSNKVLNLVRRALKSWKGEEIGLTLWANGREQGYSLTCFRTDRQVVFAQQRNGDGIIVMQGRINDFDISTNMPSESTWKAAKGFSSDAEAAEAIVHFLLRG